MSLDFDNDQQLKESINLQYILTKNGYTPLTNYMDDEGALVYTKAVDPNSHVVFIAIDDEFFSPVSDDDIDLIPSSIVEDPDDIENIVELSGYELSGVFFDGGHKFVTVLTGIDGYTHKVDHYRTSVTSVSSGEQYRPYPIVSFKFLKQNSRLIAEYTDRVVVRMKTFLVDTSKKNFMKMTETIHEISEMSDDQCRDIEDVFATLRDKIASLEDDLYGECDNDPDRQEECMLKVMTDKSNLAKQLMIENEKVMDFVYEVKRMSDLQGKLNDIKGQLEETMVLFRQRFGL